MLAGWSVFVKKKKHKNIHVPKMQDNTSKLFKNLSCNLIFFPFSFCSFVLRSFCPFDPFFLSFYPYVFLSFCPFMHNTPYNIHYTLYSLKNNHYKLYTLLYTIHFTLYNINYKLYMYYTTLCTIHFTLFTIHYPLYTIHCPNEFTLYTKH